MYGAGEEDSPLAIDENGLSVVGDSGVRTERRRGKEKEEE